MFLIDTNVISEVRKAERANRGVRDFFQRASHDKTAVFLSVVTVGELRRGVEFIRYRGDNTQAELLEKWLNTILKDYEHLILDFDKETAQVWGRLRVPDIHNSLDKQIAATAIINGLTVVTRNVQDYANTGVPVLNPFI
jgi:predicted nucleic acid-binding protein